jgi:hypothetical protein
MTLSPRAGADCLLSLLDEGLNNDSIEYPVCGEYNPEKAQ